MESQEVGINCPGTYAKVNLERGPEYASLENFKISWSPIDCYRVIQKVGRGKYSEVFEGVNMKNKERVCIKVLKPVRKAKILREVKILQNLYGGPNIVKLHDIARDEASRTPCLVFEHVNNMFFRTLFNKFDDFDCRYYMYELLKALDYCHANGIMHRDIKPQNIMFDYEEKKLRVIDWGLADFYFPEQVYNVRVASRFYKGPELLVDDTKYHYSLDIWSAGCSMAEIIFKKDPFFYGDDNQDQLLKIAKVMGTDDLFEYMRKYNLPLSTFFQENLNRSPKKPLKSFISKENQHLVPNEAIDLLERMLVYDKNKRITPKEALLHPYFKPIAEGKYEKDQV